MNGAGKKYIMYTDGGARGNPGPAGVGVVITDPNGATLKELSQFLGVRTNNWAEYEAVSIGLCALKKLFDAKKLKDSAIDVRLDSELVARQLSGIYRIKEETLFPQFIKIHNMRITDFPNITFTHIPREQNKRADALANTAMNRGK